MTRILFAALAATLGLGLSPAAAESKETGKDEPYTDAQFLSDCDVAGGTPNLDGPIAECDFASGEDIICDRSNGEITGCELGYVFNSRVPRPRRTPWTLRIAPSGAATLGR